jgi:hypothetical protein
MRKNVTLAFLPEEYLRLQGKAAMAQMPLSTYVKWLLDTAAGAQSNQLDVILARLELIGAVVAKSDKPPAQQSAPAPRALPAPDVITAKLRERGVPTSTIRQVMAVLQDVGVHS